MHYPATPMKAGGAVIDTVGEIPTPDDVRRDALLPDGTLPRYSEDFTDPRQRNQYRGSLVGSALREYAVTAGEGDLATTVQDMLSDLMHLCDATRIDFDVALYQARNRYHEEIAGE